MSKNGLQLASDLKYYLDYSRWIEGENRSETWEDSVDRVMNMHKVKYAKYLSNPRFMELFNEADNAYKEKLVFGSQRALQFGGEPLLKNNARMFNCCATYMNRIRSFQEVMYFLLSGAGVGFSVQYQHISKLPMIGKRVKGVKTFVVPDNIEGWSDAFGILISSYVSEEGKSSFPEYEGYEIRFDLSLIRPEGSLISGGFKAPGPEGLRKSLIKCEELMEKNVSQNIVYIKPIVAYDYIMHMADAVLSGGVRRCLPKDYLVQMGDKTWKKIQECEKGDKVFFEGKEYPIENLFKQGRQSLIKINTGFGFHVSTPNHRWLVYNKDELKIEWVEAQYLKNKNYSFLQPK